MCRLCSLKYNADSRRPIALRCVHTFCEVCLEQLPRDQAEDGDPTKNQQRRNKRQQLICPTCETVTPLGRGCTPSSLPVNPSIMELLGIFDRPQVRSNEVAPGYSQVKVTATTSHRPDSAANGQLGQDPNSAVSALIQSKKDARLGLEPATHRSSANGNIGETGGGAVNHVNWVSTVNIGGSVPRQQQQQQQQQHGSSFSAAKLSSAPAAMTSAITSVSTLKTTQQQSPSTSSSADVVSSCSTNIGPTSTASAAVHKCCRCGLRPAAVSVASASQTMAPQKLCSDCRNQPAALTNADEQKPASVGDSTLSEQNTKMTTGAKQPESFGVTAGKVSAAKEDPRSGVSASISVLPKTQTDEAANTAPQTVTDDSALTKNNNSVASLKREKPAVGFVVGKSTIEVRRRSSHLDSRGRSTPTSTEDSHCCAPEIGTMVDQPVQPTTVQTLKASTGSKLRQISATNVQRRSAVDNTSSDAQSSAVPATISEEIATSSGSNAGTDGNINRQEHNARKLGEEGISRHCSAPSIAEIHPLPFDNPSYNPDYEEENRTVTWSSTPHTRHTSDMPAAGRLNLIPPEPRSYEQHQRKQQPRDVSTTTSDGLAQSFLLSNCRHHYPVEQPPKYEDIITATAPDAPVGQTQLLHSVLSTPAEPIASSATPVSMKLVRSFGKYGEISTQPGAFRAPCRVSVSSEAMSTRVVVADGANGTVQMFGDAGECLSMLRADAVRGCCLLDDNHTLILATDKGVEVSCHISHTTPASRHRLTLAPSLSEIYKCDCEICC